MDELRNKLEQKNKLIEKKTQEALQVNIQAFKQKEIKPENRYICFISTEGSDIEVQNNKVLLNVS